MATEILQLQQPKNVADQYVVRLCYLRGAEQVLIGVNQQFLSSIMQLDLLLLVLALCCHFITAAWHQHAQMK